MTLLSCNGKKETESILNLSKIESISDTLLISKIIPLSTNQSNLLGSFLNVKYDKNYIWILDKDNSDAVHGFKMNGESIGYVSESGEGLGQVSNLIDSSLQKTIL